MDNTTIIINGWGQSAPCTRMAPTGDAVILNGLEITLDEPPYPYWYVTHGKIVNVYRAYGRDGDGLEYEITWHTTEAWDDAQDMYNAAVDSGREIPDWLEQYCDNDYNACNWDEFGAEILDSDGVIIRGGVR